jgi:hypothetical protein
MRGGGRLDAEVEEAQQFAHSYASSGRFAATAGAVSRRSARDAHRAQIRTIPLGACAMGMTTPPPPLAQKWHLPLTQSLIFPSSTFRPPR